MKTFIAWTVIAMLIGNIAWEVIKSLWRLRKTETFELIRHDLLAGVFGLAANSILCWIWLGHPMPIGAYMLLGFFSCILFLCQYRVENATSKWALEKLLLGLFVLALTVNVRIAEAFLLTSH